MRPSSRTIKIASASLLVLALVWEHIQATRLGYEVEAARRQSQTTKGRIAALQMELETSLSPAQLARRAGSRLSMLPPSPESLRVLPDVPAASPQGTLLGRLLPRSLRSLAASLHT